MAVAKRVEYMCTYCGTKSVRFIEHGRPFPGVCARRGKTKAGKTFPHRWVVNRKW